MVLVSRREAGVGVGGGVITVLMSRSICSTVYLYVIINNLIIYQDTRDLAILNYFDDLVKSKSVQNLQKTKK